MDLESTATVVHNPSVDDLIADCLALDHCKGLSNGAVVAYSGKYTGRTPKDKFVVREPDSESRIWWGVNNPMDPSVFERIKHKFERHAPGRRFYVIDAFAGADPRYRISARFVLDRAYHALFIRQLLIRPSQEEMASFRPDWTIAGFSLMKMDPSHDGVPNEAVIALNLANREVLIAGTEYAGEIKKSIFSVMNYLLPTQGVLSMHCSANIGATGDSALFFGLSGTGKTTLSTEPHRKLIGDDEHGWSDDGVFNIEGGCYAKCIKLSADGEPEIWNAIRRGSILENVIISEDGSPDYNDARLTENTRVAYPLDFIPQAVSPSVGGHPKNIMFLTCDALGVLPPISRLSEEQAIVYFLNGYTAKVAGTETGVTEPTITFSTCFAQPFLPLHPMEYAKLLAEKIRKHTANVWLVNTGWTGGPYGVGNRIKLEYTRAMLNAALENRLNDIEYTVDSTFGLRVPSSVPNVPSAILNPQGTWSDPIAYGTKAGELNQMFATNYRKFT